MALLANIFRDNPNSLFSNCKSDSESVNINYQQSITRKLLLDSKFVHLHLHTEYSLLDGVAKVKPLLEKIKNSGMDACAITDHGVMYGVYEFWSYARELGIKPILGCEIYIANRSRHDKTAGIDNQRFHLTLLVKNFEGYKNLMKLVSAAHIEGFYYKPRADKELLQKYGKGIIALTGCLASNFNRHLINGEIKQAEAWVEFLTECFDNVYIELQRNGIKESHDLIPTQMKIAKKLNLPVVATCDTHYLEPEDYKIQEIAWCISDGRKITDPERRRYGSREFYIKTPQMLAELFADIPEAVENTVKIAAMVENYSLEFERIQPRFDTTLNPNETRELLKSHALAGAKKRYPKLTKEIKDRINYELEVIHNKGYDDYFLVVEDYVNWARSQGILVGPGRGSGAGSVVAYVLGITDLDPFKFNLIFERFLNPERPSPPDFDIDFQDDRRDELFAYMSRKYGYDKTSFVGTFGRLKTKAAIRDVARVMGIDLATADRLSKMVIVKFGRVHSIQMMRSEVAEFDEIIRSNPQLEELAGYVAKLENLARHVSTHACGFLVTPNPVTDYVPVQIEAKGGDKIVTQIEGHNLEPLGLMKFDFLGLSNLTVISNTIKQIKYNHNLELNINTIPLDDPKTFKLFQQGDTTGVFQFESEGMKKYLRDLKPTELEDLIFLNAAYRPGPMQYIPNYIRRKQGKEKVTYLHPSLEPILKTTFGFAIYQEQVINIAVTFAGYSLGEADILRRAMGKKKPEVMAKEKEKFLEKSKQKGHSEKLAKEVFAYLEPFADYGFNRSHSACYSIIAYQTAYLKANYPLEFMAGLMETDINSTDKLERDLREAREMSVSLHAPNINKSFYTFSIEDHNSIRFGLGGIKGCSRKAMKAIVEERVEHGDFESIDDLVKRLGTHNISKKDLECLIRVGALDQLGHRRQLLEVVPFVFEKVSRAEQSALGGQTNFFGEATAQVYNEKTTLPFIDKESDHERLTWEKELLGAYISDHPLNKHLHLLATSSLLPLKKALKLKEGSNFKTIGLINRLKVIYSKKDSKPMAFISLEDLDNKIDGVIFPAIYEKVNSKISENQPLIFSGKANFRNDEFSMIVDDIYLVDEFNANTEITINIISEKDKSRLTELKKVIVENPGEFKLRIIYGDTFTKKELIKKVDPNPRMLEIIERYRQ